MISIFFEGLTSEMASETENTFEVPDYKTSISEKYLDKLSHESTEPFDQGLLDSFEKEVAAGMWYKECFTPNELREKDGDYTTVVESGSLQIQKFYKATNTGRRLFGKSEFSDKPEYITVSFPNAKEQRPETLLFTPEEFKESKYFKEQPYVQEKFMQQQEMQLVEDEDTVVNLMRQKVEHEMLMDRIDNPFESVDNFLDALQNKESGEKDCFFWGFWITFAIVIGLCWYLTRSESQQKAEDETEVY